MENCQKPMHNGRLLFCFILFFFWWGELFALAFFLFTFLWKPEYLATNQETWMNSQSFKICLDKSLLNYMPCVPYLTMCLCRLIAYALNCLCLLRAYMCWYFTYNVFTCLCLPCSYVPTYLCFLRASVFYVPVGGYSVMRLSIMCLRETKN